MRKKAFSLLTLLSLEYCEPEKAFKAMRVFLEKVLSYTRTTCTTNFIEKHISLGIAFNDVEAIARNFTSKMKNESPKDVAIKHIEKVLMKEKLVDAKLKQKSARKEMNI